MVLQHQPRQLCFVFFAYALGNVEACCGHSYLITHILVDCWYFLPCLVDFRGARVQHGEVDPSCCRCLSGLSCYLSSLGLMWPVALVSESASEWPLLASLSLGSQREASNWSDVVSRPCVASCLANHSKSFQFAAEMIAFSSCSAYLNFERM